MSQNNVYLLKDGRTDFKIKTNDSTILVVSEAINFFRSVFKKSTHCELDVNSGNLQAGGKYFIIRKEQEKFLKQKGVADDGYYTYVGNDEIIVSAYTDRGVLYGVYGFLEKFMGVRFLHPEETYIPELKTIKLSVGEFVVNPFFDMRTYLSFFTMGKGYYEFASCIRNNSNWLNLGERYGGRCQMFARKRPNGSVDHNILSFVPLSEYENSHPEFYIKDRNAYGELLKPDIVNGITENGELDNSMEESVVKSIISEMKKDILANPDIKYFSIEQEDGVAVVDEKKYGILINKYKQSGVLIRTINVIARALQSWADKELGGREIYIVTFAYQGTSEAPVYKKDGKYYPIDQTVVPAKNVVIRMAIMADMNYGYFPSEGNTSVEYEKILSWSSICDNFMFWGYDIDFHDFFNYFPSFRFIKENVRGFYNIGVKYLLIQGAHNFKQSWQCNLRAYIYSRLFTDINLSEEELFNEYIDIFYGKIGSFFVKRFINIMNEHYYKILKENVHLKVRSKTEIGQAKYLNKDLLLGCIKLFDDAVLEIKCSDISETDKEKYIKRIEEVSITPLWMYLNNYIEFNGGNDYGRYELAVRFFRLCKKLGINQYNEVALVFDAVEKYEIPPLYKKFGVEDKI